MKKKVFSRGLFLFLVVSLLVSLAYGCAAKPEKEVPAKVPDVLERQPIGTVRYFTITDLTGPTADSAIPHFNGVIDVFKDVNENGGIIYNDPKTGRQERVIIEYDWGDCKATVGPVPALYDRLSAASPKPIVSFLGVTSAGEVSKPWLKRDKIVTIGTASQAQLVPPEWIFVIMAGYQDYACAAASWAISDWKAKGRTDKPDWGWWSLDIAYGKAPITSASEAFIKNLGFNIAGFWAMPWSPVDTSAQINAMLKAGVDYAYGNLVNVQQTVAMKDATRLGVKDKIQIIANPWSLNENIEKTAGTDADGLVGPCFLPLPTDLDRPGVKKAYDLTLKYGHTWGSDALAGVGMGRVFVHWLTRALEINGYPITGDDVYKIATDSKEAIDIGWLSPVNWSPDERRPLAQKAYMRKIEGGKLVRGSEDFIVPLIEFIP